MVKSKLAIFDLDGTLFNTENVNFYAYKQAMYDWGFTLDFNTYKQKCNGRYYKDYLPLLIENISDSIMEDIHRRKTEYYVNYLKTAKVNYHLFNILELLKTEYYIAIVTTASRKNCEDILDHFNKKSLFDLILTHSDVKRVKPDPEGFLKAMEYFNITQKQTLIFEDSDVGIEAAVKSGASVFTVANK